MRLLAILLVALGLPPHAVATAAGPGGDGAGSAVTIRVVGGGWGSGEVADIQRVLDVVAAVFPAQDPDGRRIAVRVAHRYGNPMVSYERGAAGEYLMYLTARDERWYQFAYQFSHEFCHILSHFDRKGSGGEIVRDNQWFEEAVCETASLYGLRQLASTWDAAPPDPRWAGYGHNFRDYADLLLAEPHRQLPPERTLLQWFGENRDNLRHDPYQRTKNELVANTLLPLFEQQPGNWAALGFLNADRPTTAKSFGEYLSAWQGACPERLRAFVARVEGIFGLIEEPKVAALQ